MMPERLEQLEGELRTAAAAHLYAKSARLATEFCAEAMRYAGALPAGDPRVKAVGVRVEEVMSSAIVMLQVGRSACSLELDRVRTTGRFLSDALYRE